MWHSEHGIGLERSHFHSPGSCSGPGPIPAGGPARTTGRWRRQGRAGARVAVMCCCCGVGGAPHGTVSDWDCQQLRSGSWGSAVECSGALSTRRPVGSSDDARSTLRAEGFRGGAVGL